MSLILHWMSLIFNCKLSKPLWKRVKTLRSRVETLRNSGKYLWHKGERCSIETHSVGNSSKCYGVETHSASVATNAFASSEQSS